MPGRLDVLSATYMGSADLGGVWIMHAQAMNPIPIAADSPDKIRRDHFNAFDVSCPILKCLRDQMNESKTWSLSFVGCT